VYVADGGYGLFAPKCLCIITHWPFYRGLRSFLQQIYRISLSPAAVPIERYIAYFTHYVPLPPPGVHALHLHMDLGLRDPVENSSLTPITLRLPDARGLPLMDLDYDAPFRALSIDNVVKVFLLLLLEERVLFLSSSTSLLTETTETILTLLFPLEWLSCYIPRLPNKLLEVLDAPGSLIIGIHTEGSTANWSCPELTDPIWIVDLDHNRIADASAAKAAELAALSDDMPLLEPLKAKLRAELERANVAPAASPEELRERDSAFELPAIPGADDEGLSKPKLSPGAIRDAFLIFVCDLLGGYTRFFNNQVRAAPHTSPRTAQGAAASLPAVYVLSTDAAATPRHAPSVHQEGAQGQERDPNGVFGAFDVQGFLASFDPKTSRPLVERLSLTQMFAALVQKRTEHNHDMDRLVFFESCVQVSANCHPGHHPNEPPPCPARRSHASTYPGPLEQHQPTPPAHATQHTTQELKERRDAEAAALARGGAPPTGRPAPASGAGVVGGKPAPRSPAEGSQHALERRSSMLLHQAVALTNERRERQQAAQQALSTASVTDAGSSPNGSSPATSPRNGSSDFSAGDIIIPGPGAEGCGAEGTSYSYVRFPTRLNKAWMNIPPSALPPVLVDIMSKRRKAMKKGNRMVLARSVAECTKDWQVRRHRAQTRIHTNVLT
jgi:hypothetical protein